MVVVSRVTVTSACNTPGTFWGVVRIRRGSYSSRYLPDHRYWYWPGTAWKRNFPVLTSSLNFWQIRSLGQEFSLGAKADQEESLSLLICLYLWTARERTTIIIVFTNFLSRMSLLENAKWAGLSTPSFAWTHFESVYKVRFNTLINVFADWLIFALSKVTFCVKL